MKPLILTMGEPAGIGAEIAAGAWRALRASGPCFALIDDAGRDFGVPVARIAAPEEAGAVFAQALPILHRPLAVPVVPGIVNQRKAWPAGPQGAPGAGGDFRADPGGLTHGQD